MEFKIEKNVPFVSYKKSDKYPLISMEVGDSFAFPRENLSSINSYRQTVRTQDGCRGYKFSIRKISEDQFRIWRVQ